MAVNGTSANEGSGNPYDDTRKSGTTREVPREERDERDERDDRREPARNKQVNLNALINPLPGGVSRSEGGEALAAAMSTFGELVKNGTWNNGLEVKLFPIDHSALSSLKISAILVAVRIKGSLDLGVAYHTMILAASCGPIATKRLKIGDREVDVVRTADNGNDDKMHRACDKIMTDAYPGIKVHEVPATTVPLNVNLRDNTQMNRLLVNGLLGCITYLQESTGSQSVVSLKEMSRQMRFTTSLSFDKVPFVNDAQLPVRSDFTITLSSNPSRTDDMTLDLNDDAESKQIMTVRGYIDLAWTEGDAVDQYDRRVTATAHYIPRIIITSIYTGDNSYIALIAIALGMINALRNNSVWMSAMPMAAHPGDLSDYGILSLESPIDPQNPRALEATQFRSDDEGRVKYTDFLRRMVMARPQVCLDVALCGPETWQLGFLCDIANQDDDARDLLIDTINQLTDDRFGEHLDDDDWLLRLDSEIQLGTYVNNHGITCDKREIGYVQVANAALPLGTGMNNPLQKWSDSWADREADTALRLDERLRTESTLFGDINVTGMAQRLECSAALLDGIARAFAGSSFHPVMTGFRAQLDNYSRASFRGHTMDVGHSGDPFRRPSLDDRGGSNSSRFGGRGHRYGGAR